MNPHTSHVHWPYPPARARRHAGAAFEPGAEEDASVPIATGIRIVVNGRVVVHHDALHDTVEAMVRRALADDPGADVAGAPVTSTGTAARTGG